MKKKRFKLSVIVNKDRRGLEYECNTDSSFFFVFLVSHTKEGYMTD
jgi:hypothetical protein